MDSPPCLLSERHLCIAVVFVAPVIQSSKYWLKHTLKDQKVKLKQIGCQLQNTFNILQLLLVQLWKLGGCQLWMGVHAMFPPSAWNRYCSNGHPPWQHPRLENVNILKPWSPWTREIQSNWSNWSHVQLQNYQLNPVIKVIKVIKSPKFSSNLPSKVLRNTPWLPSW